ANTYDPWVKDEFVSAVTDFENVSFALLDELESLKDSSLASTFTVPIYSESGSVSGEMLMSEVVPTACATADGGSATQPPIVQAHDNLFDKSLLDGDGGT
nr:hypothetical protein [Tanacetum cinerariifolium]